MAGINQFFPFATAPGANVLTPSTWSAAVGRQTGAVAGLAKSVEANTAWRQSTVMASMLGDFIAQRGYDALDDGDLPTLRANFEAALGAQFNPSVVHYVVDGSTTANTLILNNIAPAVTQIANGMVFVIVPAITNTTAVNAVVTQQNGTVNVPVIMRGGAAMKSGDLVAGRPFIAIFYAGSLRVQALVDSELVSGPLFQSIYNQIYSTPAPYWRLDSPTNFIVANTQVFMSNYTNRYATVGAGTNVSAPTGVVILGPSDGGVYVLTATGACDQPTTEETIIIWTKVGNAGDGIPLGKSRNPYPSPGHNANDAAVAAIARLAPGDAVYATYYQTNPTNSTFSMLALPLSHFAGVRVAG